jgi:hypothetical protein
MVVRENALNREQGVAPPPVRSPRIATRNPVPFRPTQWVGVRTDRLAQHFGPAGHSVVRRAGRACLHRACDTALGRLVGHATIQTTNDAYVRAELTRLARQPTTTVPYYFP